MDKAITLTLTDEQYMFFNKISGKLNMSIQDLLRGLILDGFVISLNDSEYEKIQEEINYMNNVIREYSIHVIEDFSAVDRDMQMEVLENILKEIMMINAKMSRILKSSAETSRKLESQLVDLFSIREDITLLRNKMKELNDLYIMEINKDIINYQKG